MSAYSEAAGHLGMVYDENRNRAYSVALDQLVTSESVVLDLGAGLGIHGLMAAAKGARHVYLVDPSPVVQIARRVAEMNGLGDRVTCIQDRIEQVELPGKVDLIVSVLTGNFLLNEDLLPVLFRTRDRYLKASGSLIPSHAEMRLAPAAATEFHRRRVGRWSDPAQGLDFSAVRPIAANCYYSLRANSGELELMAPPATAASIDLGCAERAECRTHIEFQFDRPGDCHGLVGWFRMRLGNDWLTTAPQGAATHWSQGFLPFDPPLRAEPGETLEVQLVRPQFGDWSWIAHYRGSTQKHSTFLSRVYGAKQLQRQERAYKLQLNSTGQRLRYILDLMQEGSAFGDIVERMMETHARAYASREELESDIQRVVDSYGE